MSNDRGKTPPPDSTQNDTCLDPFSVEREDLVFAPDREYAPDAEPQYRMQPIAGRVPDFDIDHPGVGNTLKHYIGHEEVLDAAIEYRFGEGAVWLDADTPGQPARRDEPPLTQAQVADLIRERPDLSKVSYAEPLVFLAMEDIRGDWWGRAVAAGWVPNQEDLELLIDARTRMNTDSHGGAQR